MAPGVGPSTRPSYTAGGASVVPNTWEVVALSSKVGDMHLDEPVAPEKLVPKGAPLFPAALLTTPRCASVHSAYVVVYSLNR